MIMEDDDISLERHLRVSRDVLLRLVREGVVERETVEEMVEEELSLSERHAEDFREQMGFDELDFDRRKEFDKTIHFDEEFLRKLASIRLGEFDSAPVIDHKEVLERAVDIAYEEVVDDE